MCRAGLHAGSPNPAAKKVLPGPLFWVRASTRPSARVCTHVMH